MFWTSGAGLAARAYGGLLLASRVVGGLWPGGEGGKAEPPFYREVEGKGTENIIAKFSRQFGSVVIWDNLHC